MCDDTACMHARKLIAEWHNLVSEELLYPYAEARGFDNQKTERERARFLSPTERTDAVCDDEDTALARRRLAQNPDSVQALVALGDALVLQMRYFEAISCFEKAKEMRPKNYDIRRRLAARYMSTLQLDKSEAEFLWCDLHEDEDDRLDTAYRLALCAYYRGDYAKAEVLFEKCYPLSQHNGEMYIAVIYWHLLCLVKLSEDVNAALGHYSPDIRFGHHLGYKLAVQLFLSGDEDIEKECDGHGELAKCLYLYGAYHYHLFKGDEAKAKQKFDQTLLANTYFSSFAYLGAFTDYMREEKSQSLLALLSSQPRVAVALSGGVDSAYLCSAAAQSGAKVRAYFVSSEFQPDFERADAIQAAKDCGVESRVIKVDVLANPDVVSNGKDRCYHCKKGIFGALINQAKADGYASYVVDGTNASDLAFDRPGVKALREYGVHSPLEDVGLTKNEIRALARANGVKVADKPSYSCLATRVKTGEKITSQTLGKIESGERALFARGYLNFRVREDDDTASIEIAECQKDKFLQEYGQIKAELEKVFASVTYNAQWRK